MAAMSREPRLRILERGGCGFLVLTCFFTCVLLVLNGALVSVLYGWFGLQGPKILQNPRVAQLILFLGPVLLICIEWWLVDLIVVRLLSRRWRRKRTLLR